MVSPVRSSILLVDDDLEFAEVMAEALSTHGYATWACGSGHACLEKLATGPTDVVVADLHMEGMDGVELCERIRTKHPNTLVMMLTAQKETESAIASLQAGAWDYFQKPVQPETLAFAIARAQDHRRIAAEVRKLRNATLLPSELGFAGESDAIRELRDMIVRVAASDATVLITGESGSGKEIVARTIHQLSRPDEPFVAINCGAMPPELLESELFGHARGAFTDAKTSRRGLFVTARSGTILLDEIGELPVNVQAKLLRVLQERRVRPVGDGAEVPIHARIVAATNRNLEKEVGERRFREDLYYRINVVQLVVPPLRARSSDILGLAQHFLRQAARRSGKAVRGISPWAAQKLVAYDWPGNVRELENCIERAVALCRLDDITVDDLPDKVLAPTATVVTTKLDDLVTLDEMVGRYVRRVLDMNDGNQTRAASILGVDRRSVGRRLRYGEQAEQARGEGSDD